MHASKNPSASTYNRVVHINTIRLLPFVFSKASCIVPWASNSYKEEKDVFNICNLEHEVYITYQFIIKGILKSDNNSDVST